jgi:NADH dehydrogenase (ubiquinone) 1 alpha subcomplex subunit 8
VSIHWLASQGKILYIELTFIPHPTSIKKLRENCDAEFEKHWKCLDIKNQDYYQCRKEERQFNSCVFEKLVRITAPIASFSSQRVSNTPLQGLQKNIPGSPEGQPQIHEKRNPIMKPHQK